MDGSLPYSFKHIISNAEYYRPSLFPLATDVVTAYIFQEPSLLSSLQDKGLTDVVLQVLLAKDVLATRAAAHSGIRGWRGAEAGAAGPTRLRLPHDLYLPDARRAQMRVHRAGAGQAGRVRLRAARGDGGRRAVQGRRQPQGAQPIQQRRPGPRSSPCHWWTTSSMR